MYKIICIICISFHEKTNNHTTAVIPKGSALLGATALVSPRITGNSQVRICFVHRKKIFAYHLTWTFLHQQNECCCPLLGFGSKSQ